MDQLEGCLVNIEDHYSFAYIVPEPESMKRYWEGTDIADWLSHFPDGSRVVVTVEEAV